MKRSSALSLATHLLVFTIAGCSSATPKSQTAPPPAPSAASGQQSPSAGSEPAADRPAADYAEADARFLQQMIPHHTQALVMTEMVPTRTATDAIRLIAERIAVSQQDEIAMMQRWLRERGEAVPEVSAEHAGHEMGEEQPMMPGMLSRAELDRLAAASGIEFDRLFLEFMIQHHEGALVMVDELFGSPGAAQGSAIYSIASEVDADQRAEIARMQRLLSTLPNGSGSP